MERVYRGIGASPGIGIGRVLIYREPELAGWSETIEDTERELERYRAAVREFSARAEERAEGFELAVGAQQAEILRSQAAMSLDPVLAERIEKKIILGKPAEAALDDECRRFIESFAASSEEVLRLRAADVRDLRDGLLRILLGLPETDLSHLPPSTVLIADDLSLAAVSSLDPANVVGIVLSHSGQVSHCAILARALDIPAVVGTPGVFEALSGGEVAVVDGTKGEVHLGLSPNKLVGWGRNREQFRLLRDSLREFIGKETHTAEGVPLCLEANIGSENDVLRAQEYGIDGVGLFRTEFMFQSRDYFPTEEEQFQVYQRIALALQGRPLTLRTLDAGGDKLLPYLHPPQEENPELGCRGIRLCLREERMFRTQLRAILRASAFGNVRMMLPLITSVDELRHVRALVAQCREELAREGLPCGRDLPLGVMIETPAAVVMARLLAREADFSVGTNDLTQYVMAADRKNTQVAGYYSHYDPAVVRSVEQIAQAAREGGHPRGGVRRGGGGPPLPAPAAVLRRAGAQRAAGGAAAHPESRVPVEPGRGPRRGRPGPGAGDGKPGAGLAGGKQKTVNPGAAGRRSLFCGIWQKMGERAGRSPLQGETGLL